MTVDKSMLSSISYKKRGFISYGDNNKGRITGFDIIFKFPKPTIGDVVLVYGLKHYLLSISQLCDKDNNMTFDLFRFRFLKYESN